MAANYIYGETLQGTVDGVNKVFTSLYPIENIEDLRIDNISYSLFSFLDNVVTLQSAPTVILGSPVIDYFRADVTPTIPEGETTLLDIINYVYDNVGQDVSSTQFPLDLTKKYINEGQRIINNMKANPTTKIGSYSFNKAYDIYTTDYSATQIATSNLSTYTPSLGKILLDNSELVDYGNRTTNTFLSLTGLSIVYGSGKPICIGYKIPNGVKKVSEVLINGEVLDLADRREYSINFSANKYCIIDGYIFLPFSTNKDDIVTVNYVKNNVTLTSDSTIIDIHQDYSHILGLYALYKLFYFREDTRAEIAKAEYNEQLRLYKAYLRNADGINNTIPSNIFNNF